MKHLEKSLRGFVLYGSHLCVVVVLVVLYVFVDTVDFMFYVWLVFFIDFQAFDEFLHGDRQVLLSIGKGHKNSSLTLSFRTVLSLELFIQIDRFYSPYKRVIKILL